MRAKTFMWIYIALLTGIAWGRVGTLLKSDIPQLGTYPWYFPVQMFLFIALPAFLGFLAGRNELM